MKNSFTFVIIALGSLSGCLASQGQLGGQENRLVPAMEFSKYAKDGNTGDYTIYKVADDKATAKVEKGDPRYTDQGYVLRKSYQVPSPKFVEDGEAVPQQQELYAGQSSHPPQTQAIRYAPYAYGQMTTNPSLWPDEAQGANLFNDFRAVQAMDVVTIVVNESSEGKKQANTKSKSEFTLVAGIKQLLGIQDKSWSSNNEGLDPEALVDASTSSDFKGEGETKRQGTLKARISAVIMEVLPNGLLRLEGTKIMSLNSEEEIMVISGLIRPRDVSASNEIDSSRIANLRVDFYGRGVLGEQQSPGWGARLFEMIWPF